MNRRKKNDRRCRFWRRFVWRRGNSQFCWKLFIISEIISNFALKLEKAIDPVNFAAKAASNAFGRHLSVSVRILPRQRSPRKRELSLFRKGCRFCINFFFLRKWNCSTRSRGFSNFSWVSVESERNRMFRYLYQAIFPNDILHIVLINDIYTWYYPLFYWIYE